MKTPPIPDTCIELPRDLLAAAWTEKDSRHMLTGALVDAKARRIVVCNGRTLAMLPIPGDAEIKPAYITPDKFKAVKAIAKGKTPLLLDFVAGTIAGLPLDPPDVLGDFPNYQQVIPNGEIVLRQSICPALLLDAAKSLGWTPKSTDFRSITLEFSAGEKDPVRLRHGGATGVLMPMVGGDLHGLLAKQPERSGSAPAATDAELSRLKAELHQANEGRKALAAEAEGLRAQLQALGAGGPSATPAKREGKNAKDAAPKQVSSATGPPSLKRNEDRNGIELRFDGKPDDTTRDAMKSQGFRWCPGQPGQPWVAKYSEENWVFAMSLSEGRGVPVPQPGEVPETPAAGPCHPPTGMDEAPPIRSAVIHGGESITPAELAKRLMSGRDGKIPTPAELEAERKAADATPPPPRKRILPDF